MAEGGHLKHYKSPGTPKESGRKGRHSNLTGQGRKLRDKAAELHNAVGTWETLNAKGNDVIRDIINVKLQHICQQDNENREEEEKSTIKLFNKLEPKCQALQHIVQSMGEVVKKLQSLSSLVEGLCSLSVHQGESDLVVFTLWTIRDFVETFQSLHSMYAKEWRLKRELCGHVASADSRPALMVHAAAWMHQPYLDSAMLMDALLRETGHDLTAL